MRETEGRTRSPGLLPRHYSLTITTQYAKVKIKDPVAMRANPAAGLEVLISSGVKKFTLLIGSMAVMFSLSAAEVLTFPLDSRQAIEFVLAAAVAVHGLLLIAWRTVDRRAGAVLLVFFVAHLFSPKAGNTASDNRCLLRPCRIADCQGLAPGQVHLPQGARGVDPVWASRGPAPLCSASEEDRDPYLRNNSQLPELFHKRILRAWLPFLVTSAPAAGDIGESMLDPSLRCSAPRHPSDQPNRYRLISRITPALVMPSTPSR